MVSDAEELRSRFESIYTPSRIFEPVESILGGLNRRVLRESVKQAAARVPDDQNTLTVEPSDLLSAVRTVLANVCSEVDEALACGEPESAKKAS